MRAAGGVRAGLRCTGVRVRKEEAGEGDGEGQAGGWVGSWAGGVLGAAGEGAERAQRGCREAQ